MMYRSLRVLFRRDSSRDRHEDHIRYEGYEFLWPDGRPLTVTLTALCKHGQRLFGLGRHLRGTDERLLDLFLYPLPNRESPLTRLPGHRVRRFALKRHGREGRLYFLDGTPTTVVFHLDRDEAPVLHWLGLPNLRDGEELWFDLAARPTESVRPKPRTRTHSFGFSHMPHDAVS
jgi:hypothetical protein